MTATRDDAEIRAALIAAARVQMSCADTSRFNIKGLCAEVGISRAEFRRCFSGKEALIAAVVTEDVSQLHQIAEQVAEPRAMVNGAPLMAPAPDQWLERRLRVFERALASLEARQEKSEQMLNRGLQLLEEKLSRQDQPDLEIAAPAIAPVEPETPAQEAEMPAHDVGVAVKLMPMPAEEAKPEPPISQKEMDDFIAQARRAAQAASLPPPAKPKSLPRWVAWAAVACAVLMVMTAWALGNVAGASVPGGTAHRQPVQHSLDRVIALADSGDARGETLLALAYLRGEALPADQAAALRWGLAAAEQGEPMAQYLIATLYQQGDDGDPRQAFAWFEAAALRGNLKAMHDLAIAYAEGQGTGQNSERAAAWFNRAAGQGYVDSQFDLAVLYERGDGVRQNPKAALKWYLVAAKAGDAQARDRAAELAKEMAADDVGEAENMAANFRPSEHDLAANAP